jgi:serine/threonine protein kinase/Flp pilus assembly protein TadD
MSLSIGTILDKKYKVVQVLGEGGMGTVYKVEQAGTAGTPPRYYAIKELLINPNINEEERRAAIDRFSKEIDMLEELKHPRIPSLKVHFQENGNYYFAMEFVPGRSLEKMLEDNKGPLPEDKVITWLMQVCEALSYIHSRTPPIILRDLKPGNIMVTPDGTVQLIDFGIARRFDPSKRTNTENLGTISYASPEHLGSITAPGQRRSAQNPGRLVQTDARSDIYSLGATMYHLLTDYEPDPIQTPAPGSIRAKNLRLRTVVVNGRMLCPVEQVIIKAMQQDPAQRFQSADAMRAALQHCLPSNAAPPTLAIPAISPNATMIVPLTTASGLVCSLCGFQNRPGAKFCKRDGQPLVQGATTVPPQRAQVAPRAPIQARPVQSSPQRQPIQSRPIQQRPVPQSIKARPVPTAVPAAQDAQASYRLGLQHFANKRYIEAINQFRIAQRVNGTSYDILYNLGRAYRQYGQALKDTDRKLAQENLKFAAERFEEAVKLKPDAFDTYFQLGMCYRDLALYAQASSIFKRAQGLNPRDSAVYYQLGLAAMEQGSYREAEGHFLEGLKISPMHTSMMVALGRLYIEMNRPRVALDLLQQATKIDPLPWEAWYELARAHMKMGEWRAALGALEVARQNFPDQPLIYSAMATCYLKLKKKSDARLMVNETLKRDPTNAEAIKLQKQL